ncbi:type III PLP-dependent enzyme [Thalassotalea ganghwensis]
MLATSIANKQVTRQWSLTSPSIEHALKQLSRQTNEPLCAYIYDLNALAQHAQAMVDALPENCQLFYAAKANAEAPILATLKSIVHGFEAASGGELSWLCEQLPDETLIFGGPGKLDSELRQAINDGVEFIHVESLYELQRLQNIAEELNVRVCILLRMNIALGGIETTKLTMGGKATPFGLDESQLDKALTIIQQCPNVKLEGFHFHLMSHQLCLNNHLKLMALYFDTFQRWQKKYHLALNHLNVGGGIGVNYTDVNDVFDWPRFCHELKKLINEKGVNSLKVRFECGRYISAACGYYCMEVLDIKKNHGENFVIAKGGTHHFRTPAAQGHSHPFTLFKTNKRLANSPSLKDCEVTIVGQLCTPKDVLAKGQWIDSISVGDYVVFNHAGAYAWNISHQNFLMHQKPDFLYV